MTRRRPPAQLFSLSDTDIGLPRRGVAGKRLASLRPGALVLASDWDAVYAEERLRLRALAVDGRRRTRAGAGAHATAAALDGLPLYRTGTNRVSMTLFGEHPRRNGSDVTWHFAPLDESEIVEREGMRVTSLDRTVYDVIRTESLETAVACFDAALRMAGWDETTNEYDNAAAEECRALVRARVFANPGARGIIQARFVTRFADGRAQLPGESVSRLWMAQLGIRKPELQYRVALGGGKYALLDFAWPDAGLWCEFDGEVKYSDGDILRGRHRDDVLAAQAERERKIRAATGWQPYRWGFEQMQCFDEFVEYLREIRLYPALRAE